MDGEKESNKRLPYEKPRLRTISLVAEEVLAVNCKQFTGAPGKNTKGCGATSCSNAAGS